MTQIKPQIYDIAIWLRNSDRMPIMGDMRFYSRSLPEVKNGCWHFVEETDNADKHHLIPFEVVQRVSWQAILEDNQD